MEKTNLELQDELMKVTMERDALQQQINEMVSIPVDKKPTKKEIMAIQDFKQRQKLIAENIDLF